jgi:hypothetical protein
MNSKPENLSKIATANDKVAPEPLRKMQTHVFYEGECDHKITPTRTHAFYDPSQGGFTKRFVNPR